MILWAFISHLRGGQILMREKPLKNMGVIESQW